MEERMRRDLNFFKMSQERGRGRGKEMDIEGKTASAGALQLLNKDIEKYRTKHIQKFNITTPHKNIKQAASSKYHSQSPVSSPLHIPSSSFSSQQSNKHMPPPSVPLQHRSIASHSPLVTTQLFAQDIPPIQRKQTLSCSSSSASIQSFTQNVQPSFKPPSQQTKSKQTLSRSSSSTSIQSFTQNIQSSFKPLSQQTNNKQTRSESFVHDVRSHRSSTHREELIKEKEIMQSLKIIMDQLRRMEERQISIENKTDENTRTIKRLLRESAMKRPTKPQGLSFKTVDDFLAFEEVDEEVYNDLVGYFIYLGRANPIDCAAEYFRSVFPEDEEVSSHLTLNGKNGQREGCKLRDSRFAQACQDAMNSNKYFTNPNNIEFYDALEKALKSLKTRKWRYNKKRHQENEEEVPPNRRRRIDNEDEKTTEFEETEEIDADVEDLENGGNDDRTVSHCQYTEETEEIEDAENDDVWDKNYNNIAEETQEDDTEMDDDKIQERLSCYGGWI